MKKLTKKRKKELFKAIRDGELENVKLFLDEYPEQIDVRGEGSRYFLDKTPLMYALQSWQFGIAEFLIDGGADVNATLQIEDQQYNHSVLYFCVYSNIYMSIEILEKLLRCGANPNVPSGTLPLDEALNNAGLDDFGSGDYDAYGVVKLLLDYGADLDYRWGDKIHTPRMSAAHWSHDIPESVCKLVGVEKKEKPNFEHQPPILEHPDGTFTSAYQALREGFAQLLDCEQWVNITVGGGTSTTYYTESLYFRGRTLVFPRKDLTQEMLKGCRVKVSLDTVAEDSDGRCVFSDDSHARQLAGIVEVIMRLHYCVRKLNRDWSVSFEWAPTGYTPRLQG